MRNILPRSRLAPSLYPFLSLLIVHVGETIRGTLYRRSLTTGGREKIFPLEYDVAAVSSFFRSSPLWATTLPGRICRIARDGSSRWMDGGIRGMPDKYTTFRKFNFVRGISFAARYSARERWTSWMRARARFYVCAWLYCAREFGCGLGMRVRPSGHEVDGGKMTRNFVFMDHSRMEVLILWCGA